VLSLSFLVLILAQPVAAQDTSSCADQPVAQALRRPTGSRPILFDEFIRPLAETAAAQRAQRAEQDPSYAQRVDSALNTRRLNVALLGYGEEHEQTYSDVGVSVTIVSLNLDTWDMASISLSRDIRAPELEDQSAREPPRWPVTLRAGYKSLGFGGMRYILEDATGLAIDFQLVMKDVFLRNYLNDVGGPIELVVPKDFHTNVYRLDGMDHAEDVIPAGRQTLSTDQAMTFVLGEEVDPQLKVDERSYRKDLLLKTLSCQARQRLTARDAGFVLNLVRFSVGELQNQDLSVDFDFKLISGGLGNLARAFIGSRGDVDASFPQLSGARELVVHEEAFGDGGVRRVHQIAREPDQNGTPDSPLVKEEIQMGSLAPYMLIPIGGNPYATDLVADYWASVRQLVRATLG
jgi:hypothetical protein